MNLVEKRDFIHSRLHQADENLIDEIYEMLCDEDALKAKRTDRGYPLENDLRAKAFPRPKIEQRRTNANQKDFYY